MEAASSSTGRRENISHEITQVDVFIHHRGADVIRTLASSIDYFLECRGVTVFLDREEPMWGDLLPKEIEDVMRSARIHIAIFSTDYARSPCCLEELSFMLEIERAIIPRTIIPVFYHVEPSDLRVGVTKGLFADAFSEYETNSKYKSETLEKWKQALHNVSFRNGYVFKSNSDEGNLLGRIVDRVQQEIKNVVPLKVAPYPCLAFPFDSVAAASSSTGRRENAFDEITQVASSSTTLRQRPYDVFINHRGPDVKLNLASPIYHFLDSLGVKAFFDREELHLGNLVPQAIDNAMRSAKIHIAIFSKNYAASPWCLAELSFMLETGAPIIPVFYEVQPDELRWLAAEGTYAQAFRKYEAKRRYESETLDKWKTALQKVSYNSGEIQSNGDLGILLRDVVDRVQQEIKNKKVPFEVAAHPVGLEDAVQNFEGIRSAPVHQTAQIVGILGMVGCGKTTLARELYNRNFKSFDKCSFLPDVRKAELPDLQKELLKDLVHLRNMTFMDASEGKSILTERLRSSPHRMLIVLDDVDKVDQLNALLPEDGKSLGSDSLVIVTTRDSHVLQLCGISSVYKMTTLDPHHAKELFCWHAFKRVSPPATFERVVQDFINACNGLPLSLKFIGDMLYGRSEEYWRSNLKKISRSLPNDIKERLKPCYDALDKEEVEIFLDVACFFDGEKKSLASAVWEDEWSGLQSLEDKCLVEVDKQNRLKMHSQLRELGRQIAIERSPHRLWKEEQIKQKKRMPIRGIMAATTEFVKCPAHEEFPGKSTSYRVSFQEMDLTSLKLLVVDGDHFNSDFTHLSMDLVWLRLFDFQLTNLPSRLSLKELRVLELYGTSRFQQLWENNAQAPEQLREMIITATEDNIFHSFPIQVSGLLNLTKIALISSLGKEFLFEGLPDEFCCLQSLEHLELRHCTSLSSLPIHFGELRNLRHLDLCSCKALRMLPESFQKLTLLNYLDLSDCKELDLQEDVLKNITELENLYLSGFLKLQKLPSNIGQLEKLKALTIGSKLLKGLPDFLGDLSSLKSLSIIDCPALESLPKTLGHLKLLEHLYIETTGLRSLPEGFRQLANLRTLKISDCPLSELGFGSVSPFSLGKLTVINLSKTRVTGISISEQCCPILQTLRLSKNHNLEEIETLPPTVNDIELSECEMLKNIKGIQALPIRPNLSISACAKELEKTSEF